MLTLIHSQGLTFIEGRLYYWAKTSRIGVALNTKEKRLMGKDKKLGAGVAMEWQKDEAGKRGREDWHRNLISSRKSPSLSLGPPITRTLPTFHCYTTWHYCLCRLWCQPPAAADSSHKNHLSPLWIVGRQGGRPITELTKAKPHIDHNIQALHSEIRWDFAPGLIIWPPAFFFFFWALEVKWVHSALFLCILCLLFQVWGILSLLW